MSQRAARILFCLVPALGAAAIVDVLAQSWPFTIFTGAIVFGFGWDVTGANRSH